MTDRTYLDVSERCRMSGEFDDDGDIQFTVCSSYNEANLVFEPAALRRFVRLASGLLGP